MTNADRQHTNLTRSALRIQPPPSPKHTAKLTDSDADPRAAGPVPDLPQLHKSTKVEFAPTPETTAAPVETQSHLGTPPALPRRPTTADMLSGVDLTGRRALITGASSGLGEEIARALTSAGAEVTLAVRNADRGAAAANRIAGSTGRTRPAVLELDLLTPASITAAVTAWSGPLHILVANAGIMVPPLERTAEGWESQFMTNYLAHFALITGLLPALVAAEDARVVLASSNAHLLGPVDVDALTDQSKSYEPWSAYAISKTALILFAVEANRRWAEAGVTVSAYNPGYIRTGLQKNLPADLQVSTAGLKTLEQGAATPVSLAATPAGAAAGGKYFEDMVEAPVAVNEERDMSRPETFRGVATFALDEKTAAELWTFSQTATRHW
ncbi:MAG: SDR family NAD(P)-dependent oxidoreductase [Janthinobacterium lividum]